MSNHSIIASFRNVDLDIKQDLFLKARMLHELQYRLECVVNKENNSSIRKNTQA